MKQTNPAQTAERKFHFNKIDDTGDYRRVKTHKEATQSNDQGNVRNGNIATGASMIHQAQSIREKPVSSSASEDPNPDSELTRFNDALLVPPEKSQIISVQIKGHCLGLSGF